MDYDPTTEARQILEAIQSAVDARDHGVLDGLFDDGAVLIGTSASAPDRAAVRAYTEAVVSQPGRLRWDWDDVVPFHVDETSIGFAAFGTVTLDDFREPIRATLFAVGGPGRWRLRQFHGSIPHAG